ncbi:hypothetical protein FACS189493_3120 [Spirochaetia bacterium]|nr:hypothetical protein FACS189493_3120 [Spirochaetia bacterium]
MVTIGDQYHLFLPGGGEGGDVPFRVIQCPADVRVGLQRVHEEQPADDRFHVPHTLNAADHFGPGGVGKGNQVKRVPQPEEFPEEGSRNIGIDLSVGGVHAGRGIQDHDEVNRGRGLTCNRENNHQEKHEKRIKLFQHRLLSPCITIPAAFFKKELRI